MEKIIITSESKDATPQKEAFKLLNKASSVFGYQVYIEGLKHFFKYQNGGVTQGCDVNFVENKEGSWMLFIREIAPNQPYCNIYTSENVTILLGWGLKTSVLAGEDPISSWGNGNYYIEDVPVSVVEEFEKSEEGNYQELQILIKNYKKSLKWGQLK